jgi:hypothetical protein
LALDALTINEVQNGELRRSVAAAP